MTTVITAKLSLALRLLDTTTGREITERDIRFLIDGEYVIPMVKEESVYVFVNLCKEDFLMQIKAFGYDQMDMQVNTTMLDPLLPMMDVFLMPSEKNHNGGDVLAITGTLSGLEYIEAINLNRPICIFHSEEKKKEVCKLNLLPLVPGGGVRLDCLKYALLGEADERYDCFTVKEQDSPTSVILKDNLQDNESYFVVEIKSLKRIFDELGDVPLLCFIDEVLRGTNTAERIATSSEILKSLSGSNAVIFAATHDIELTNILKDYMKNYHFSEQVEGDKISFDYKIKEGSADSRNAIKLLKAYGFSTDIVVGAEKLADGYTT